MATSPDLGLPLVASQQQQPEITHNEAVTLLAALINGVIGYGGNAAPGSPAEGDAYIVGATPTGAWAVRANCVAVYTSGGWRFVPGNDSSGTPITMGARQKGFHVWLRNGAGSPTGLVLAVWDGAAWQERQPPTA